MDENKIPCQSDYRSGDELNPASPYYEEPLVTEGQELVEIQWAVAFDPPHPEYGHDVYAIVKGRLAHLDISEAPSRSVRQAMRRASSHDDFDPAEFIETRREFESFEPISIEFPGGKIVHASKLSEIAGAGSSEQQFEGYGPELLDEAVKAVQKPLANKMQLSKLRASWAQEAERTTSPSPKA